MLLNIRNFRSIREQEVKLAPITLLYGLNGAGKSSLIYALLTIKNVLLNPNQTCDAFFNFGWLSLGAFDAVVFEHVRDREISFTIKLPEIAEDLSHRVTLQAKSGRFELHAGAPYLFALSISPSFPYPANQPAQYDYHVDGIDSDETRLSVTWNGIAAQVQTAVSTTEAANAAKELAQRLNSCLDAIRGVDVVPIRRGFFKPHYAVTPMTPALATEDEMATFLAGDKYLQDEVSLYLEEIVGRNFSASSKPGAPIFSLNSVDRATRVSTELVNDGFGTNQLVYLLTKALYQDSRTVCIEEPEVHLHPSAVRNLLKALASIATDKRKCFVLSTHSSTMVTALLALVKAGHIDPGDVCCYLTRKQKRETIFELQTVDRSGQKVGGVDSFLEGELEDLQQFFGVTEETDEENGGPPARNG